MGESERLRKVWPRQALPVRASHRRGDESERLHEMWQRLATSPVQTQATPSVQARMLADVHLPLSRASPAMASCGVVVTGTKLHLDTDARRCTRLPLDAGSKGVLA
jgi:hypothetical protein